MPTRMGSDVCGPHSAAYSVTCDACGTALDPFFVQKHMRRCPRARTNAAAAASPWYCRDVNRPPVDASATPPATHPADAPILNAPSPPPPSEPAVDPPPSDAATLAAAKNIRDRWGHARTSYARLEERHFTQGVALASLLAPVDGSAVAEAGAGRAYISLLAAELLAAAGARASFLAVDRGANRNKMDGALRQLAARGAGVLSFERARVDVRHLSLAGAPGFKASAQPRIVGKHLCGAATDAALKAADDFCRAWRAGRRDGCCRMVIAPCCRSVCEWGALHGVAEEWGCAGGREAFEECVARAAWGLNRSEGEGKARQGKEARRAIDGARVRWMRKQGWHVQLVRYVEEEITTENIAIVAVWDVVQHGAV